MTATTAVLSIAVGHHDALAHLAGRRGLAVGIGLVSHHVLLRSERLGRGDLALAQLGVDAGDVAAQRGRARDVLSSWPVTCWKRRLNSLVLRLGEPVDQLVVAQLAELVVLVSHQIASSRVTTRALIGSFWMARSMASLAISRFGVRQLEQDAARLDDGDPALGVALARAHAGLGRLLGDGLVREDVDPDLAATLDVAGHGDTGGLDLAGGDPARLEGLDAVLAER